VFTAAGVSVRRIPTTSRRRLTRMPRAVVRHRPDQCLDCCLSANRHHLHPALRLLPACGTTKHRPTTRHSQSRHVHKPTTTDTLGRAGANTSNARVTRGLIREYQHAALIPATQPAGTASNRPTTRLQPNDQSRLASPPRGPPHTTPSSASLLPLGYRVGGVLGSGVPGGEVPFDRCSGRR